MIFVTVGSQRFQFNRLLTEIERIDNFSKEEFFVQTGYSTKILKGINNTQFMDRLHFSQMINKAEIIITHAGTGSIIKSLNEKKKVIVVPRYKKFGEHVDDHQSEIASLFFKKNHVETCIDISELHSIINKVRKKDYANFQSNNKCFTNFLLDKIKSL
ncbi:PssE/Cps14G family polysaccharide biosynthesis glycosyltransferase [Jeotgalibacillus proteolyticus]|uniref:PssE/Cps14G family polysaccharide biosynthesis glycosyltransferase n=1 Tax=Jeotgalibacillus proteolyticus TaxID=2082395 RepID=UPI003CEB467A